MTERCNPKHSMKKFKDICTQITDGSHYSPPSGDSGIPYVTVKDISNDRINFNSCKKINEKNYLKLVKSGCQPILHDILFSKDGTVGKVCLIENNTKFVVLSSLAILTPNQELILPKYFYYYLKSPLVLQKALLSKKGVAIRRIILRDLKEFPILLPSLSQQKKIISEFEELFSQLDKGIEQLKKAKEQIKTYRQAVLNYAFTGRLVNNHNTKDLSTNNKNQAKETANENTPSSALPEGWKWVKVSGIGEIVTGTTPSKKVKEYYGSDFPLYKPTDLNAGIHTREAKDNISNRGVSQARILPKESIMITCIGATIGKTGMNAVEGATNQQINSIIPSNNFYQKFVYYFCISNYFQEQIKNNASSTTLPILNKSKFMSLPFVEVPINQQKQIVEEIESRFSVADKLEQTIDESLKKAEVLRQAILKQAFEGKLV